MSQQSQPPLKDRCFFSSAASLLSVWLDIASDGHDKTEEFKGFSMNIKPNICSALLFLASMAPIIEAKATTIEENDALTATITALDSRVFNAYNSCDLTTFSSMFSPSVEFYHDTGGATFDRKTVIANTKKYICNKVRRELVPASLRVYPIKDYGAIAEGEHRFCQIATGVCEGIAKFVIVWKRTGSKWQITRVLSFGHKAIEINK